MKVEGTVPSRTLLLVPTRLRRMEALECISGEDKVLVPDFLRVRFARVGDACGGVGGRGDWAGLPLLLTSAIPYSPIPPFIRRT